MKRNHIGSLAVLLVAGPMLVASVPAARGAKQRALNNRSTAVETAQAHLEKLFATRQRDGFAFVPGSMHVDNLGQTHVRFGQTYQGVKVWGAEAITHMTDQQRFTPDTLALASPLRLSVQPSLDKKEALAIVHNALSPRGAYHLEPQAELVVYPEMVQTQHRFHTRGNQTPNALEVDREVKQYRLAYYVHVSLENDLDPVTSRDYMVDANSGVILAQWSSLQTAKPVEGKGYSQYSGTVVLDTTALDKGFEFRDTIRPKLPHPKTKELGNVVYNCNHVPHASGELGTLYTDDDNIWGDGLNYDGVSTTSPNGQTAAVDAAYGLQVTWDFFGNVLGRDGIDDKGTSTYSRVHVGKKYDNAFWSNDLFGMTYGDGSGQPQGLNVVTPLDVVGHEMSHGVCFTTAKLIYSDESGGLNEANSDILGTMVEFYERGGGYAEATDYVPDTGGNWTIGEQLQTPPLRFMFKPSRDKHSPDAWSPTLGKMDVHFSSGPMNRAFYFLSQGATTQGDTSAPTYLPKGMKGIGNNNATKIWYQALTCYLPTTATYKEARSACLRAAQDVEDYGPFRCNEVSQADAIAAVQNAFAGINVGLGAEQCKDITPPEIHDTAVMGNAGSITLCASVYDDSAVGLVEFWVDDALWEAIPGDKGPLFALSVDTTTLANGPHSLMIKAYDAAGNVSYSPSHDATTTFYVKNPVNALLNDGGFEWGTRFWKSAEALFDKDKANAHAGNYSVLVGGKGKPVASYIYQINKFPVVGKKATLRFWVKTTTQETGKEVLDKLNIYTQDKDLNPTERPIATLSNLDASDKYVEKTFEVKLEDIKDGFALIFEAVENEGKPTSWRLDDITLTVE